MTQLDNRVTPTWRIVWKILNRRERRGLIGVLFLMLVGTVLETLSLGLVIPFVGLLTQQNYLEKLPWLDEFLGRPTEVQFIIGSMVFLVLVYVVKTVFLIWSLWIQRGFSNSVTARVGRRLFEVYMHQPYSFHLSRNSAHLIRNSQNSAVLTTGMIDPWLSILSDAFVGGGLFALLIFVEPRGTFAALAAFGISAWLFRQSTTKRIRRWGEAQNFHKGMILQHLQQGFGGVKDVKLLGREKHFIQQYEEHLVGNARVSRRFSLAQGLPRHGLELLTILGLAVLVGTMVASGRELSSVLPVLGLFGASAFRLLPAVNRVINNFQIINMCRPIMDSLDHDLALGFEILSEKLENLNLKIAIELQDIYFAYDSAPTEALSGVSLQINRGEAVGLIGPSGSGKSTLIDVLLGLLAPTSGNVLVDGVNVNLHIRTWQDQIGYVPQSIFLTDESLRSNVALGIPKSKIDEQAVRAAIRSAQLEEFVATLPNGLDTVVGERGVRLSGGQRQRIGIARALYHNPSVLVLDEATSSLDTETEHGVMQAVQALQGDKTVIIVAHRLSTVEYCDRLYRLEDSRIVDEGSFQEVTSRSKNQP